MRVQILALAWTKVVAGNDPGCVPRVFVICDRHD